MTDAEKESVLRFGKANLTAADYADLRRLVDGAWSDDYFACMGFVYDNTPDDEPTPE